MVTGIVSNSGKRYGTPFRINAGDDNFYDILHSSSFPFSCFFFLLCSCRPLGCTSGTELTTGERGTGNTARRRILPTVAQCLPTPQHPEMQMPRSRTARQYRHRAGPGPRSEWRIDNGAVALRLIEICASFGSAWSPANLGCASRSRPVRAGPLVRETGFDRDEAVGPAWVQASL
jgi:hypothetical protein